MADDEKIANFSDFLCEYKEFIQDTNFAIKMVLSDYFVSKFPSNCVQHPLWVSSLRIASDSVEIALENRDVVMQLNKQNQGKKVVVY